MGLALGRESLSFTSVDKLRDSTGDLLSDAVGILLAIAIKSVF